MTHFRFIIFTAVIFLTLLIGSIAGLYFYNVSFKDTFFPEVFGFALEGLLIFTGLSSIQFYLAVEKRRLEKLQRINSLREIALGFISYSCLIASFHDKKQEDLDFLQFDHNAIEKLLTRLINIQRQNLKVNFEDLVDEIKINKSIYDSGLIISSQINSSALTSWKLFLQILNKSIENNNITIQEVTNALELLTWLKTYAEHKNA